MAFGNEYTDDNAYFIAGGRTLALVKEYDEQKRSSFGPLDAIAAEVGGIGLQRDDSGIRLYALKKLGLDWLDLIDSVDAVRAGTSLYVYSPNAATPEGKALIEKVANVPGPANEVFGKWLTGNQLVATNPDNLQDNEFFGNSPFNEGTTLASASYKRYGDTYVVSVPRVIRGVFNEEAKKLSQEEGVPVSAGYSYQWFTPPDSKQIPYSKVLEMQEKLLGDQLKAPVVKQKLKTFQPKN